MKSGHASLKATKRDDISHALEEARQEYAKAEGGHRIALDRAVTRGIEKAEELENNTRAWLIFQGDARWSDRKAKPETLLDTLFFSLLWILDDRKQASKIHKAIRPLYRDLTLSAADIVKQVRDNGGYEKSAQTNRQKANVLRNVLISVRTPEGYIEPTSFPCVLKISIDGAKGRRLMGEVLSG